MSRIRPMQLLRGSLACVLGGSAALVLSSLLAHRQLASHLTPIASAELVGAVLLLVPKGVRAGVWVLFATLLSAALFHLAHHEVPPAAFLVYAAGLLAVASDRQPQPQGEAR